MTAEKSIQTSRIFVSFTFSDLKADRNALQEPVFRRLRELCAAHGTRFRAIDLRWGVSEEASLDQQTMRICLGEIANCHRQHARRDPGTVIQLLQTASHGGVSLVKGRGLARAPFCTADGRFSAVHF